MKQTILIISCLAAITVLYSCGQSLELQENNFGVAGSITINGYVASDDSVQITLNDENMTINSNTVFTKSIETEYEFVNYYTQNTDNKNIKVIDNRTLEVLQTYIYSFDNDEVTPNDTLSFFYKSTGIWLNDVLSVKPGVLSQSNYTGYRFIFPNINAYSNSGYTGAVDAILKRYPTNVLIDTVKNIGTDTFSNFIEFEYAAPPIIQMELVKHGTSESYLTDGTAVTITATIESGKSKLIVLEETADEDGNYADVEASIDLTKYFDY